MSAHTPGPWKRSHIHPDGNFRASIAYIEGGDKQMPCEIATLYNCDRDPETAANADLIAQAPALLEIAREYADSCAECGGTGTVQQYDTDDSDCAVTEFVDCPECAHVRAVIAAVEGAP